MTWKSEQANWQIESPRLSSTPKSTWRITMKGSSFCPTRLGRRTNTTIRKERICQNHWCEVDAPFQCFGMEQDSLKKDEVWVRKRWWSVGLMEKHGWRNGHEKRPNEKLRTKQDRSLRNRVVQFTMVLLKVVQEPVVVPQIQYIAVCDGKTSSLNFECSETVEVPKSAVQR